MVSNDQGKTSVGLQANLAALFCYLPYIGIIASILFVILEKQSKYVKFHAIQSLIVSGFFIALSYVLGFIPVLGFPLSPIIVIVVVILWIFLMIKAYQGEYFKLPIAGDIAEQNS